jgi:adenosylmethionine-8-amino-7-oxononanoate aminotransferase
MTNSDLINEDLEHIFHPCSQMKDYEKLPLIPIQRGKGVYLEDFDGNHYLDAISSWWVNLFGHANPKINTKLKNQLDELEHVIFAGFTHKPAVDLARRLKQLTPDGLDKVFFADNGSSAIEIALKMSFHYYKNRGETRPIFISLENSYHGETMGALAVGDVEIYKEVYNEILIQSVQAKSPALHDEEVAIADMARLLEENEGQVSAVIIEPLVQCAGSMQMYDPSYIKRLRSLCDNYGVHLIADEVAVGFGRTGTLFAVEQADVSPDFLCLSKGITGGYLPLSVTMLTNDIYQAFYCDYNEGKSFLDSHSYTGNTLACAAANAVLDIFEEEQTVQANKEKIAFMEQQLKRFEDFDYVKETRQRGMIGAVELQGFDPLKRINLNIYQYALKHGVLLRPLGPVVYFMPPFTMTIEQLQTMFDVAYNAIASVAP